MVTLEERKELNDIDITIDCEPCRIHLEELTGHITASFPGGIEGRDGIKLYTVTLCAGAWTIGNNHGAGHVNDRSPVDGRLQSLTAPEGQAREGREEAGQLPAIGNFVAGIATLLHGV